MKKKKAKKGWSFRGQLARRQHKDMYQLILEISYHIMRNETKINKK